MNHEESVAVAFLGAEAFWGMSHDAREWELIKARRAIDAYLASVNGKVLECGGLKLDTSKPRKAQLDGEEIDLTKKEYDLLLHMMQRQGAILTYRAILLAVWGPAYGDNMQYLRVYISQLREKIPGYINTQNYVGYVLKAPVRGEAAA